MMLEDPTLAALTAATLRDPRFNRRAVSYRWFSAVVLAGLAGSGLLGGALLGSLSADRPEAPRFRRVSSNGLAGDGARREDRLMPAKPPSDSTPDRTRLEQFSDATGKMQPFVHVRASLGQRPAAAKPEALARTETPGPALPPEILFGASHAPPMPVVNAYAATPEIRAAAALPRGIALNVTNVPRNPADPGVLPRIVVARPGDRVATILNRLGLPADDAGTVEGLLMQRGWLQASVLKGGETLTIEQGAEPAPQRPQRIVLAIPGTEPRSVALADDGHYRLVEAADRAMQDAAAAAAPAADGSPPCTLREALATIAEADRIDPGLMAEAERLLGHDVDLDVTVSARDKIELLYTDNDLGQPELTVLGLERGGHPLRYYRFTAPDDASSDYYDASGHSVTAFLLRKPVAAGRLGDGFGWRIHPVLGDRRFHEGVDYAAPYGSPIAAAGAGIVEKIDEEWGYGKYIRIRHDLGYETTYAHVAGFPRGLAVGKRVRQGQTIAFIGSTGLSTGPHLYYEVKVNGHNVDPLRVRLAGGRTLDGEALAAFTAAQHRAESLLDAGHQAPAVVPPH